MGSQAKARLIPDHVPIKDRSLLPWMALINLEDLCWIGNCRRSFYTS